MKNQALKKTIIALVIILSILIVVDCVIGFCGDRLLNRLPNYGDVFAKNNYRLNRCREDIIILGSSRGANHYVSSIFRDSLNQTNHNQYSVYNVGMSGRIVNSNACSIESILNRYIPKLIILEIRESELREEEDLIYADMEFMAAHYWQNATVKHYIDALGWKEQIKMQCNVYRYNDKLFRLAMSLRSSNDNELWGYEPKYGNIEILDDTNILQTHHPIHPYCETNLRRILTLCKQKKVNLILITSPGFRRKDNNDYLKVICQEYNTPYIDMYHDAYFNQHPELFRDIDHLNDKGAHIFSSICSTKINEIYFDKKE